MVKREIEGGGRGQQHSDSTIDNVERPAGQDAWVCGDVRRDVQVPDVHKSPENKEEENKSHTMAGSEELIYPKRAAENQVHLDPGLWDGEISPSLPRVPNLPKSPDNINGTLEDLAKLNPCWVVRDACYIALLQSGPLDPPVTTESLRELDLPLIKNNLSLRIDVNYDHDLHFMPISGRRGEEKRDEAQRYWQCIVLELRFYQHDNSRECPECKGNTRVGSMASFPSRLPTMFEHMKALILLLVPDDDHQRVEEVFDVEFLVQQMRQGVLDAGGLARWLKALLTAHCAPIRDDKAEEMAEAIYKAAAAGSMHGLALGLEMLFAFLECMRLDVANHQIRTYRIPLIEDGIPFQIDYFEARILQRKLSVEGSRQWFQKLRHEFAQNTSTRRDILAYGLIRLCTSEGSPLPITFKHDESRLHVLQQELRDEVHLRVCRKVYQQILTTLLNNSPASKISRRPRLSQNPNFSTSRIIDLTDSSSSSSSSASSAASSSISSYSDCPSCNLENTREYSHYNDSDTWHTHIDSIALEITHQASLVHPTASSMLLTANFSASVRSKLHKSFEQENTHHEQAAVLEKELRERVIGHVEKFDTLSALDIAEVQKAWQLGRTGTGVGAADGTYVGRTAPDLEDVTRRIAHMSVVHWRVWRGLAYTDAAEDDVEMEEFDVIDAIDLKDGYGEPVMERTAEAMHVDTEA